jgi:hypothetical protein
VCRWSCRGHAQLYPKKAFYLWTGANNFVQLSGEDFLSVGGYPALMTVAVAVVLLLLLVDSN